MPGPRIDRFLKTIDPQAYAQILSVERLLNQADFLALIEPMLTLLTKKPADIRHTAQRVLKLMQTIVIDDTRISLQSCESEIGSGAQPTKTLPSFAVVLAPQGNKRVRNAKVNRLSAWFRTLPVPVLGRIQDGALWLDMRGLDDERALFDMLEPCQIQFS